MIFINIKFLYINLYKKPLLTSKNRINYSKILYTIKIIYLDNNNTPNCLKKRGRKPKPKLILPEDIKNNIAYKKMII